MPHSPRTHLIDTRRALARRAPPGAAAAPPHPPAMAAPADAPAPAVAFGPLTEANVEQVRALNRAIFPVNYPERVYQDMLACGPVTQLALAEGGAVVGAVGCRLEAAPGGPRRAIMTLGVLAPYRGGGIGSALLRRALAACAEVAPEAAEAYLHVQQGNDDALRFYARHGFEVGETVENYYRRIDPPHAVVLRLRLPGGAAAGGRAANGDAAADGDR